MACVTGLNHSLAVAYIRGGGDTFKPCRCRRFRIVGNGQARSGLEFNLKAMSGEDIRQGTRYIIKRSYLGEAAAET